MDDGGVDDNSVAKVLLRQSSSQASALARFRNSKLTLLLANALSGNSRTAMIGT